VTDPHVRNPGCALLRRAASTAVLAAACLAAGIGTAAAQSILSLHDAATGETSVYTPADSLFSLDGDGSALNFSASVNAFRAAAWYLRMEAPEGERLAPGRYERAGCTFSLRTGRSPGLEVTDNNPVCRPTSAPFDAVWGRFAIRQIAYDDAGRVTSLEAVFTQRVGSPTAPPLAGLLRYNAAPLSLAVTSDPGFAWGPIDQRNFGDTSLFSLKGDTTGGLQYQASVTKDLWSIAIQPPSGRTLRVGRYNTRSTADAGHAGFNVLRGHGPQGCSGTGRLEILGMDTDPAGNVLNLHATFEYRCNGAQAALRGTIHHLR